jgi:hypothetical protein
VKPEKLRTIAGESELVKWRPAKGPGGYCRHCGVAPYVSVDAAAWNDGDYVSVNVACLDGVTAAELDAVPVVYLDGLHDTWAPMKEHTGYL